MKTILKGVIVLLILGFCAAESGAIPKDLKAKSEYLLAESKFNAGDYIAAVKHLKNARKIIGKTNSDIQLLLVKSYWELEKYNRAKGELDLYFEVTPKESTDFRKFNEMVVMISRIEEKINGEKEGEESGTAEHTEDQQKKINWAGDQSINNVDRAYSKAFGNLKIPLNVARKEGIPSPPYNTVVGKQYTHRETSVNSGTRSKMLRMSKIVGYIEEQSIFLFEQMSINQSRKPYKKDEPKLFKLREDGTCNSADASFIFKDFKCIGENWPKGLLKTGDMWMREVSWGTFKSVSTYKVNGFEKIKGHDCISVSVSSVNYHGGSPTKSSHEFFWDYNKGVLVLQTSQANKKNKSKIELVSVEFPEKK